MKCFPHNVVLQLAWNMLVFTDTELRNFTLFSAVFVLTLSWLCSHASVATGESILSLLRGSFHQPSQICGFMILRQASRNVIPGGPGRSLPQVALPLFGTWLLCLSTQEVRGRDQTSLLGAVRPLHQQRGGAGQPPQDPGRSGGCEGRAEDAGRCPQCFVVIVPHAICVRHCCCLLPPLLCSATCDKADSFLFLCCASS